MVENNTAGEGILAFTLPRLAGPALAIAVYLPLHRAGVVAPLSPWWFIGIVAVGTSLTIVTQYRFRKPASLPQLHVRYAAQCASITGIVYCTGWGPGLAIVYIKSLADNLEISGSRAAKAGTLWALGYMSLAQAGIAAGLVPTLIAAPGVHGLAVLAAVGLAFVYWLMGTTAGHRERAEARLRESERRLRDREAKLKEAQALSHLGSWHWDVDDDVVALSDELRRILGLEPGDAGLSFEQLLERVHPEDRQLVRDTADQAVATGEAFQAEHRIVRPDGSVRWLEARGRPVGAAADARVAALHGTALDITERRQLEDQLLEAMKMRAIGKLAGGVAHDFNNLLTVIGGYVDVMIRSTDAEDPRLYDLRRVRDATGEAADLTGQLLAFGRRQVLHPEVLDVGELAGEMIPMLRRLIRANVEIDFRAAPATALVEADPTKLKQVIMNLAINARDAMPEGGTLSVAVELVRLDRGYLDTHPQVEPGDYVLLHVSDTGVGMDEATLSRVFEPFFTTKELGKGTGLGLATVYGFVQQSGGYINVYSEPGEGTTFKIYLPQTTREVGPRDTDIELPAVEGGTETILVAEDNVDLRELCCRVLEARGYEVLPAADAEEALAATAGSKRPIDLLITDLVMPGGSGTELAESLRSRRPDLDLRVLFISGHGPASVARHGAPPEGRNFLPKPFSPDELAQRVRQVLDAAGR